MVQASATEWWPKDAYATTDQFVDTLLYFTDVYEALTIKWQYFKPDGSQFGSDELYNIPSPQASGYQYWSYWSCWNGWLINGYATAFPPGLYSVKVWINDGSGYKLIQTKSFSIQYQFTENEMCQGVQSSSPFNPINPGNVFYQSSSMAWTWANYNWVAQQLNTRWDFYEPNGTLYSTTNFTIPAPSTQGSVEWSYYRTWGGIYINGYSAQNKCGNWQAKVYVQNAATGNWDQIYTDYFQILESPNISPNVSVSVSPTVPLEGQALTLNVLGTDNTYLKKVVLHWNNGGIQTWDNIFSASFSQSTQIGSFTNGTPISFWVEAWDTSGNYTASQTGSLVVAPEAISVPNAVIGANILKDNQIGSYQTGGAMSNLGNPVAYQFDWGDGTQSAWGSMSQTKSWSANGNYFVEAHARSQTNTNRVSDWSNGEWVTVDSIAPAVVITNNGGMNFTTTNSLVILQGTCNDADPSSGLASVVINTGATNQGTIVLNNADWAFAVNLTVGANTLVVSATDRAGNIGNAQIVVTRVSPPILNIGSPPWNGNVFNLSISAPTVSSVVVQVSTNLVYWVPIYTNVGSFMFTDTNAPSFGQRFYRAVEQ